MTHNLRQHIKQLATEKYQKRIEEATKIKIPLADIAEKVVKAWIDNNGLSQEWSRIPSDWKPDINGFKVLSINGKSTGIIDFPMYGYQATQVKGPSCLRHASFAIEHPSLEKLSVELEQNNKEKLSLVKERDDFVNTVMTFLERHNSLQTAVKEWPQVMELIPKWVQDKYNKDNSRKKPPLNVDFDDLNTKLVISKIVEV